MMHLGKKKLDPSKVVCGECKMQSLWKAWQFLKNQNPNQTKQKRKQATIKLS